MRIVAIILAAGQGTRMDLGTPKQYVKIVGRSVLSFSAEAFASHAAIHETRIVIRPEDLNLYGDAIAPLHAMALTIKQPLTGGATRQESVRNALEFLAGEKAPDAVLIHDAARPLVSTKAIDRTVRALATTQAVIPALPVNDTLKYVGTDNYVIATPDRKGLYRAQTPQGFHFQPILDAHRAVAQRSDLTDDATVAEEAGVSVMLIDGDEHNIKITTEGDLRLAEKMLTDRTRDVCRTGMGFDTHRFGPGDQLILCGVRIPHKASLMGHSDADVGLHALTDAILGAIGEGDIGEHFPDHNERWKNEPSSTFLTHATSLLTAHGGTINNVDIIIICEAPRIAPYRAEMRKRISSLLQIPVSQVNVKATTTEKLGFLGREEGISVQALATVYLTPSNLL